jgi:hypothetical protein
VVLLHCLGVDHRFWDFAATLADEFTLLRYATGQRRRRARLTTSATCRGNSRAYSAATILPMRT